jgi:DNA primase
MNAADIISRVQISHVAEAHGVTLDRTRRRGIATWREGRNFSVSFDDGKNCFHDFVTDEGGGVLDFIARVRGCNRKEALEWLANYAGVPLEHQSEAERRRWKRRRVAAEREATELVAWRDDLARTMRVRRNSYQSASHRAVQHILRCGMPAGCCALAADVAEIYETRYQELDEQIDDLLRRPWAELLLIFRAERLAA